MMFGDTAAAEMHLVHFGDLICSGPRDCSTHSDSLTPAGRKWIWYAVMDAQKSEDGAHGVYVLKPMISAPGRHAQLSHECS